MIFSAHGAAYSFPFRAISPGDPIPPVYFTNYRTQQQVSLSQFKGRHIIVIFWGADLPSKKRRSVNALKELENIKPYLEKHSIVVLAVNAQGDDSAIIDTVVNEARSTWPVYIDKDQKAYERLGIFVMPAILLVDKDGKIVTGMGYSREFIQDLKGEIEILLGEKNRDEVNRELHPVTIEKTTAQKNADRHLHMGLVMLQRGMTDSALREFEKAIALQPDMGSAYIEAGCLYLEKEQIAKAGERIKKGLDLTPDSIKGQICRARLKAAQGKTDEALQELNGLSFSTPKSYELHYALGELYQKNGLHEKAAVEYKKAYDLFARTKVQD